MAEKWFPSSAGTFAEVECVRKHFFCSDGKRFDKQDSSRSREENRENKWMKKKNPRVYLNFNSLFHLSKYSSYQRH